ncbi:AMP-binding protein [Streptomyces sp. WAC 01529]|uniref:AMP-binding protein n=1 Tax=Streptomyces sp. WAC 01529 TaxID=2203205 RepID=UPI0013E0D7EB|nr:AMP-binding protein [Streptomyces sp. WAC 01529]
MADTLDGLLSRAASAHPRRTAVALSGTGEHLDFGTLDARVTAAARGLRALRLAPGATVAVASVLHPDFAVAYYAAARAGLVTAVVNPLLREEDLLHVLTLGGAEVAFVDGPLYARLKPIQHRLPGLRRVVLMGGGGTAAGGSGGSDGAGGSSGPIGLAELTSEGERAAAGPDGPDGPGRPSASAGLGMPGESGRPSGSSGPIALADLTAEGERATAGPSGSDGPGESSGLIALADLTAEGERAATGPDGPSGPDGLDGLAEPGFEGAAGFEGPRTGLGLPSVGDPDAVVCVQFTSGTTGRPKAVRLTHRNLTLNATQIAAAHRVDASSVCLNHLPTYHPMHLNSAVAAGATQVLCPAGDPAEAVAAANAHRATHLYSLPVRLIRLAAHPGLGGLTLETVRRIASGGSALPAPAARALTEHFGIPVLQGYGLAETSPLTHSDDPDHPVHGSVGRPLPGTECRVVDVASRAVLAVGEVGEVQLRGPQLMKGYLGGPDGTGLEPDGWLSTGDVGRIADDGRLFLVDRLKDVFKCDNFLVAPSEVEQALNRHPRVADSVVVDLPHEFSGAVAGALVVLTGTGEGEGDDSDPRTALAEIVSEVNEQLPYYQHLQHAEPVAAIPRSGNGKIQRRELRDRLLALRGQGDVSDLAEHPADPSPTTPPKEPAMSAPQFTVVNTFTLKDPARAEEFERRFLDHVQWMRQQPGFVAHQAVRRADQPEVYVNFGWWQTGEQFKQVLSSDTFQAHAKAFHELVTVDADPSLAVLRLDGDGPDADEGSVLVIEYLTATGDPAELERAYRAYAEEARTAPGFRHTDLARSVAARPGGYSALTRWSGEEAVEAARSGASYAAVRALADVRTVVAAPLAGTRAALGGGRD